MKDGARVSRCSNEKGSTAYGFLGFAIIVVVVIGTIAYFPWNEIGKGPNPDMVAAGKAMSSKDWKQAITLYDKVLKTDPAAFEALLGRSRAYVQVGNLDKALADANAAVEKRPGAAAAYGQRGIVEKLKQNTDKAQQDFSKAVKLDPGYVWAYAQRADLSLKQNEYDKALANVNRALSVQPNFVEALRLRAWVLNRMGKCKDASVDFVKVEQLSPKDAWSVQDRAWFLLTCPDEKVQDTAKAMELAKEAVDLPGGKDGLIYETLAEAYFRQGDPAKAAEVQKKAIEMGSKKCPDGSCTKEMKDRLQKYELAARQEIRQNYEILPLDSGK
jgi:tetratricopeptide (TPR) repeat protein